MITTLARAEVPIYGDAAQALNEGKAVPLVTLLYFPERHEIDWVALPHITKEEVEAMLKEFNCWPEGLR